MTSLLFRMLDIVNYNNMPNCDFTVEQKESDFYKSEFSKSVLEAIEYSYTSTIFSGDETFKAAMMVAIVSIIYKNDDDFLLHYNSAYNAREIVMLKRIDRLDFKKTALAMCLNGKSQLGNNGLYSLKQILFENE